MSLGLLLPFLMFLLLIGGVVALAVATKRLRLRFSLRTLLIFVTLVAVALGAGSWWRSLGVAETAWLEPSSAAARQLEPQPVVAAEGEEFKLTFSPKRRAVQELTDAVKKEHGELPGQHGCRWDHQRQQVEITAEEEAALEGRAEALEKADSLQPGTFVIRGRVEDRQGRPVPDATVDLAGVYVNYCRTRADGTFTLPIQAPPGSGYYLRIRYGDEKRMRTSSFSLSASEPERVVLIRVR